LNYLISVKKSSIQISQKEFTTNLLFLTECQFDNIIFIIFLFNSMVFRAISIHNKQNE